MSYYRDVYLKSDEWKTLRSHVLVKRGTQCEICGFDSLSNDVHHLAYKRLHDVTVKDVRVLCRLCHDQVHVMLKKYKKLKKLERSRQWLIIKMQMKRPFKAARRGKHQLSIMDTFYLLREKLRASRKINSKKMPWLDYLERDYEFLESFGSADEMLVAYVWATKSDPRINMLVKWTPATPLMPSSKPSICGIPRPPDPSGLSHRKLKSIRWHAVHNNLVKSEGKG